MKLKLWQKVKILEENKKRETNKLPPHDRNRYYIYKFPLFRSSSPTNSLEYAIRNLIKRFVKVMGVRVEISNTKVFGYGTKNHHKRFTVRIYYEGSKHGY